MISTAAKPINPGTAELSRWLWQMSTPVRRPLAASIGFRHLYFLAQCAIMALGSWSIVRLGQSLHGGRELPLPLIAVILALVGLTLFKALTNYLEHFLGHVVAFKALELLRVAVYQGLIPQATSQHLASGDVLSRATSDIDRIEVFFAHTLAPLSTALSFPIAATLLTAYLLGPQPAAILAVGLFFSAIVIPLLGARATRRASADYAQLRGQMNHHLTDSVQGMSDILGYGHEHRRLTQQQQLDQDLATSQLPTVRAEAARAALAMLVRLGTLCAVVAAALAWQPSGSERPVDLAVLAAVVVTGWVLFDITDVLRTSAAAIDNSFAAAERVYRLIHSPPAVRSAAQPQRLTAGPVEITIRNLEYSYPQARDLPPILQGIDLDIAPGEHIVIMGESGSGKSTLLQLLARYDDPVHGHISVAGVDLRQLDLEDLRRRVVLLEQQAVLFAGTVAENLRLAVPEATDAQIELVLEQVGLAQQLASRGGAATQVGDNGAQLSGGQRQRLALARALLLQPAVLLLDEYSSHLDSEAAVQVRHAVRQALPEATIVEASHIATAQLDADRVLVCSQGRLSAA